jgi:hypothetical protein
MKLVSNLEVPSLDDYKEHDICEKALRMLTTLEEKCAICNWPKNDYGHIQLIYNSAAKKLH